MFVLDTDILSLLLRAHARVTERVAEATEEVAITMITRIEILQGGSLLLKRRKREKILPRPSRLCTRAKNFCGFTILAILPPR